MTDVFIIELTKQLKEELFRSDSRGAETKGGELSKLIQILRSYPDIEEDILFALLTTPDVQDPALYIELLDLVCRAPKVTQLISNSRRLPKALNYVGSIMERILDVAKSCRDSPASSSAQLSLLLQIEQLACKLLQRKGSELHVLPADDLSHFVRVIGRVFEEVRVVDCLTTASMLSVLSIRATAGDKFEEKIYQCLVDNPRCENDNAKGLLIQCLDRDGPSLVRVCAMIGLIGMLEEDSLPWLCPRREPNRSLAMVLLTRIYQEPNPTSSDHTIKLLFFRSLHSWHKKLMNCVKKFDPDSIKTFSSLTGFVPSIEYVFDHFEDTVDIVKYQSREIFEFILKTHYAVCEDSSCPHCQTLSVLLKRVMRMAWERLGKYPLLSSFCALKGGSGLILDFCPKLPEKLVKQASVEQCVASTAGDLYGRLLSNLAKTKRGERLDVETWARPVFQALVVEDGSQSDAVVTRRTLISQYFLPKLVKHLPESLEYLVDNFCKDSVEKNVAVVTTCFRRAKLEGTLNPQRQRLLGQFFLRRGIVHYDQQVRLDAFALLCEHKKTSEPVTQEELDTILIFLKYNMDGQTPAFRQQLVSFLKKLFARLHDGFAAAQKRLLKKRSVDDEQLLGRYVDFVNKSVKFLLSVLQPGVSFPRRITALSCLGVCRPLEDERITLSGRELGSLLLALTDSFEENRAAALAFILRADSRGILETPPLSTALSTAALELAESVRPQDAGIACGLLRLVQRFQAVTPNEEGSLLEALLRRLGDQIAVARESLLRAASTRPLYPTLQCLRNLVDDCPEGHLLSRVKPILEPLLEHCYAIAALVSPIVANASPEGNCPLGPGFDLEAVTSSEEEKKHLWTAAHMPEYLVVCCWRSVKEVSLLLGLLATKFVEGKQLSLSREQILRMGEFFRGQLLESRHRGAFELAATGFSQLCESLWRCADRQLAGLPSQWLGEVLEEVHQEQSDLDLCATRRSAGLPHFVKCIVVSEQVTSQRTTVEVVMKSLLEIATEAAVESSNTENFPLIHALNILRTLYRDSALGEEIQPYVADGVKMAIVGFSSPVWSIRNSATMLFSSLMQRIFGVTRSRDDFSKKNRLSSRVFFHRYPSLYEFLLHQLQICLRNFAARGVEASRLHPRLYPLLLLLSRLLPPAVEASDSSMRLDPFVPLVHRCGLLSGDFRIRTLAARAMLPLVHRSNVEKSVLHLIETGLDGKSGARSANAQHGLLLQIEALLQELTSGPSSNASHLLPVLSSLLSHSSQILNHAYPVVKSAFLRCAAVLFTKLPCQQAVELFFYFLGPHLLTLISVTSEKTGDRVDRRPGDTDFLLAFSSLTFVLLEALDAASRQSNVPLDLIDNGLDYLCHLALCRSSGTVRAAGLAFLLSLLEHCRAQRGDGREKSRVRRGDVIRQLRKRSGLLLDHMTALAAEEEDPEVLANLWAVLGELGRVASSVANERTIGRPHFSRRLAEQLENGRRLEAVMLALPLIGRIWPFLAGEERRALKKRFVAILHLRCGWDQASEMRQGCARALRLMMPLATDEDPDVIFPLWDALFTLLNDYEAEIRHQASGIVAALLPDGVVATPRVAMEAALALFVQQQQRHGLQFWERTRDWILCGLDTNTEVVEEQEVRLFERGEMNVYMDQVAFSRAVCAALLHPTAPDVPEEMKGGGRAVDEEEWSVADMMTDSAAFEGLCIDRLRKRLWRRVQWRDIGEPEAAADVRLV